MQTGFHSMLFDRKHFENDIKANSQIEINKNFITKIAINIFFFENLQLMFIAMQLTSPFLLSLSVIGGVAIKLSMIFIINHIVMICTGGSFLLLLMMNSYFIINSIVKVYELKYRLMKAT